MRAICPFHSISMAIFNCLTNLHGHFYFKSKSANINRGGGIGRLMPRICRERCITDISSANASGGCHCANLCIGRFAIGEISGRKRVLHCPISIITAATNRFGRKTKSRSVSEAASWKFKVEAKKSVGSVEEEEGTAAADPMIRAVAMMGVFDQLRK